NIFFKNIDFLKDITLRDIKTFVAFAQGDLKLDEIFVRRLIPLILLAEFFKANKTKNFTPKKNLLDEFLEYLVGKIQDKHFDDFFNEKGLMWEISNSFNDALKEKVMKKGKNRFFYSKFFFFHNPNNNELMELVVLADGSIVTSDYDHYGDDHGDNGIIYIWSPKERKLLRKIEPHGRSIVFLLSLQNGSIASADYNGIIKIWDVKTGKLLNELKGHKGKVTDLLFLPDGKMASASYDKTIRIWNMKTGKSVKVLSDGKWIWGLSLLPNGNMISHSNDKKIRVWNQKQKKPIKLHTVYNYKMSKMLVLSDGKIIFTYKDGKVVVTNFDLQRLTEEKFEVGETLFGTDFEIFRINESVFAFQNTDLGRLNFIDFKREKYYETKKLTYEDSSLLFLPDDNFLEGNYLPEYNKIKIFSVKTGNKVKEYDFFGDKFSLLSNGQVAFIKDREIIVLDDVIDFYSGLSFDQFVFVKTIRLVSSNFQKLKKLENRLIKAKKMKELYLSLPQRVKKIIKNLKWLPLFEKLPQKDFLTNLDKKTIFQLDLLLRQSRNIVLSSKPLVEIDEIRTKVKNLKKQLSKLGKEKAESILDDFLDVSMVIQVIDAFKKYLKNKQLEYAKLAFNYLKDEAAKKEGKYIPEKLLKQFEKQLEKAEKAKRKKNDEEEEGEEEDQ
ncbi:hypothetical protein KAH94_00580, partial [bacterium]|nr:hypothetical protein [bacterium]